MDDDEENRTNRLVWTRSLEDWPKDAVLLDSLESKVIHLPCLQIEPVPIGLSGSDKFDCTVFTSARAAALALADERLSKLVRSSGQIVTHGKKTAAFLKSKGLPCTYVRDAATGEELAARVSALLFPAARVLFPCAAATAFDMNRALSPAGISVEAVVCYRTQTGLWSHNGRPVSVEERRRLILDLNGVVCFGSPSAIKGFTESLRPFDSTERLARSLIAVGIGPTTSTAAKQVFQRVETSPQATLESLIEVASSLL